MPLAYIHERLLEIKWDSEKKNFFFFFRTEMVRQLIVNSWTHLFLSQVLLSAALGKCLKLLLKLSEASIKPQGVHLHSSYFLVLCECSWSLFEVTGFYIGLPRWLSQELPAMWETWVWSLGWEDPLEKGTATHSSILAWRIPWTEKPGRLQSMGLQSRTWLTFTFTTWKICSFFSAYSCLCSPYWCSWLPGLGGQYHEDLSFDWHMNRLFLGRNWVANSWVLSPGFSPPVGLIMVPKHKYSQ